MNTTPILTIHNVSKIYHGARGTTKALDNVSLTINQGEIFGLLGVNGAGKTTLSSLIATLHPATEGDILYNGISIYKNLYNYRRIIGLCPQKQNLDTKLTVHENLLFAGRYFVLPEALIQERAENLMTEFSLTRYRDAEVDELSGGTKQRLLIARALMHDPKIVILDEPTVGLDPDIRRVLWDHIKALKSRGITVILTTHYLDEAEMLSDRVCILNKGAVVLVESLATLQERYQMQKLEDIFIHINAQSLDKE